LQAAERTLEEDLTLLCRLAQEAGDLAMSYIHKGGAETWNKTGGTPVTEADLAVNRLCARNAPQGAAGVWLAVGRNAGRPRRPAEIPRLGGRPDRRHEGLCGRNAGLVHRPVDRRGG
jgi:hypothetical protein